FRGRPTVPLCKATAVALALQLSCVVWMRSSGRRRSGNGGARRVGRPTALHVSLLRPDCHRSVTLRRRRMTNRVAPPATISTTPAMSTPVSDAPVTGRLGELVVAGGVVGGVVGPATILNGSQRPSVLSLSLFWSTNLAW